MSFQIPFTKRNLTETIKSQSNRRFTENTKKKLSLDETAEDNFLGESLKSYSKQRINKSLSSISDPFGAVSKSGAKSLSNIRPSSLSVHNAQPPAKNSSILTLNDAHSSYARQLSVPNTDSERVEFDHLTHSSIYENFPSTCKICGICNNQRHHNDTSSRFTVTTLARNKSHNSINSQLKGGGHSTLSRNGGVLIAVKDWIAKATPVASTVDNSQCTLTGGHKVKMPNSNYESFGTTSSNLANNNNPPYENQSIILQQQQQKLAKDEQGNPAAPVYAVVNKQNKLKNRLNETKYSYIGIADPTDRSAAGRGGGDSGDSDIYETINVHSYNNISSSNNNNNNNNISNSNNNNNNVTPAVKLTNFSHQNSNIKTSHITTTTCINSNDTMMSSTSHPLPTSSSSSDAPVAGASADYSTKVWKGVKKSSTSNGDGKKAVPRMWTCTKCSYAYNALWVEKCDICECSRSAASLNQPSLTTVTKDGLIVVSGVVEKEGPSNMKMPLTSSKSLTHGFDEMIAAGVKVPMATFEQDLEDDFQFLPGEF
jgi:hypothetical protein